MTKTKKIASIAVSAMLAMSMMAATAVMNSTTASADCTITLSDTTNTYTYYQIFTGTVTGEAGSEVLTDAQFGSGVISSNLLSALSLGSSATASDALDAMSKMTSAEIISKLNQTGVLINGTTITSGSTSVADGYYFITETLAGGTDPVSSGNILTFLSGNSATISTKYGAPSVEKKIQEDDRTISSTGETIGDDNVSDKWNDVGDYSIGDTVNFVLYGTMPETIDNFTHYYYQFSDDLGSGFTLDSNSIKVYYDLDGTSSSTNTWTELSDTSKNTVSSTTNGFTITFNDIKSAISSITKDTVIKITYSATLNENAVVGASGNTNGVNLTYTNDTNYNGQGNPSQTETTTDDGVAAFTYTLSVTKTDDSNPAQTLSGVTFYLKDSNNKYATVDSSNDRVTGWVSDSTSATLLTTDTNGQISVIGLDSGTYSLHEESTLTGYNKLTDDVEIVISAGSGLNTAGNWTYVADNGSSAYAEPTITVDSATAVTGSSGVVSATVVNAKGENLPETGSFGTKLFYIGGGVIVAAAGVILVTRKRMSRKAD